MRKYGLFPIVVLLFCAALIAEHPRFNSSDKLTHSGFETLKTADNLARTGQFANPFEPLDTGPSTHLAPAFPFIVAVIIKFFGDGARGAYVLQWLAAFIVAIQLALMPYLSRRFKMPTMAGLFAALIFLRGEFATPAWEVNYVGLLLILLAFASFNALQLDLSRPRLIAISALWGVLLLFTPVVVIILPVWLFWLNHYRTLSRRSNLILVLAPIVVISPWLVRNAVVFHKFIFIRGNLGMELAASNNRCATYDLVRNVKNGCYPKNHPNQGLAQAILVRSLGEVEYNHEQLQQFLQWFRHNPLSYAKLSFERFAAFWFPWNYGDTIKTFSFGQVMTWIMTILGFLGVWQLWKTNRPVATYLLMWLLLFPVSYYFIVAFEDRHRIPILWASFIPASDYFFKTIGGDWDSFLQS